jgi:phage N-6-adenine-methyltransferase
MSKKRCRRCRQPIEQPATGRPRWYCSVACKQALYRKRLRRSIHFRSDSYEWATPADFFAQVDAEFHFDLDACASPDNTKCPRYFTRQENGLAQRWTGRVWCNPPYGKTISLWMKKAVESVRDGDAEIVVCLVHARTDTRWWHEFASKGEVRYLRGRLRFGGADSSAPFPSV